MDPFVPSGQQAVAAWRSLSPAEQADAWAAARARAAVADLRVAAVAAGYGARQAMLLWGLRFAAPFIVLAVACALTVPAVLLDLSDDVVTVAVLPFAAAFIGALLYHGARYRRLATAGQLGVEAARARTAEVTRPVHPARPAPAGVAPAAKAAVAPAGVAPAGPAPAGPAPVGPAAAGAAPVEIRADRWPVALALGLVVFSVVAWATVIASVAAPRDVAEWIFEAIGPVVLAGVIGMRRRWLRQQLPLLTEPVQARFGPAGWELPTLGVGATWAEVTGVDVRFPSFDSGPGGQPTADRAVVLRVTDARPYLAIADPVARSAMRANLRDYGSPLVLVAGPHASRHLGEVLAALARYSAAPVCWTAGREYRAAPVSQ